jgi:hypothetical protein
VLSAVFLPLAFFSGSTGVIYRQFLRRWCQQADPLGVRRTAPAR